MEKFNTFKKRLLVTSLLASVAASSFANAQEVDDEKEQSKAVETTEKASAQVSINKTSNETSSSQFQEIKFSKDFTTYQVVDGDMDEKAQQQVSEDDRFYIKNSELTIEQWRAQRDKKSSKVYRFKKREKDCWSFGRCNQRDGFHYAFSFVSSHGDNFYSDTTESTDLDSYSSYRAQFAGFFFESPGVSTRRIHGLYADRTWGFNFYNTDQWRLDIYKDRDTKGTRGLDSIKTRNKYKRAGLRLTGFFDSSMLQMDVSPYTDGDQTDAGIESSLSYSYFWQVKNWNFYGSAGVQFQGKEVLNFYEADPVTFDGRSDRINRDVEFGFEYPLSEHFILGGFAAYSHTDQPLPNVLATSNGEHKGFRSGLLLSFVL